MNDFRKLVAVLILVPFLGCAESQKSAAPSGDQLEQYLADNPEIANAEEEEFDQFADDE